MACRGRPTPFTDVREPDPAELRTGEFVLRPIVAGDIEQATARYEQLYRQVRDAVTSVVPSMKWRVADAASDAACGDHEVVFHDQYRAELNFGTAVNTTLLLRTGCHLTTAARARGVPAPEPSY